MSTDDPIATDFRALAIESTRCLPSTEDTARALDASLARRSPQASRFAPRRSLLALAGGLVAAAAVMAVPVPYAHRVGWDVTLRSHDGRVAVLHLGGVSESDARHRAASLGTDNGATVSLAPRSEMVWGPVYALAAEKLFHVRIDMQGKSDSEVETEIRAQLAEQGWTPSDVQVTRVNGDSHVSFGADDGKGGHVEIVRNTGAADEHVQIDVGSTDDEREPGMTDDQLRDKIIRQWKARGFDADVTVQGDRIQVKVQRSATP